ncbi:hypothetical protein, partial [uncultured Ruminococcus sp.]|uniref:hypothetical protein n=1 Tax=uncultured Ruminococcus sp. TaxID=165186 RepID=UPI002931EE72
LKNAIPWRFCLRRALAAYGLTQSPSNPTSSADSFVYKNRRHLMVSPAFIMAEAVGFEPTSP